MSNEHDGLKIYGYFSQDDELPIENFYGSPQQINDTFEPFILFTPAQLAARDEALAREAYALGYLDGTQLEHGPKPIIVSESFEEWWAERKGK